MGSAFLCLRLTGIYGLLPLLLLISRICRDARFATRSEPVHESEAGKKSPRSKMHFASVRGDSGNLFVPYFHAIKSEAFSAADRAEIRQSDCLSSSISMNLWHDSLLCRGKPSGKSCRHLQINGERSALQFSSLYLFNLFRKYFQGNRN